MRALAKLTCLWPGLATLWWRGEWEGLYKALAFSAGLNLLLVVSFLRSDLLPLFWLTFGWVMLLLGWGWSTYRSWRDWGRVTEVPQGALAEGQEDLFLLAQTEYLQGHWFEAESLLRKQLRQIPRDVEAQLLLVSLFRRSGRPEDARKGLVALTKEDASKRWAFEMQQEQRWLERDAAGNSEEAAAASSPAASSHVATSGVTGDKNEAA